MRKAASLESQPDRKEWTPIPLPKDPTKYTNRYGFDWWYMYPIDSECGVWAKVVDGEIDIVSLTVLSYSEFQNWGKEKCTLSPGITT